MSGFEAFIDELYSNEYFAPVLFTFIGILSILFIIVLIMALKDARKTKKNIVGIATTEEDFEALKEEALNSKMEAVTEPVKEVDEYEKYKEYLKDMKFDDEDKKEEENEIKIDDGVVDKIEGENDEFEEIHIDVPSEYEADLSFKDEAEKTDDVKKAESELDEIAATLLKEYQKETSDDELLTPLKNDNQISSVFVNEEKNDTVINQMPSLSDIPLPQPVKVVSQVEIVDTSKETRDINSIETEEYSIRR